MLQGKFLLSAIFLSGIFYVIGILTVRYNLFPYPQLLSFKNQVSPAKKRKPYQERYYDLQDIYLTKQADIVMLGDSLTSMVDWKELFNIEIVNRGVPGDTTEGYLKRMDNVYKLKPKKVFLNGGTNDFYAGFTVEQIFNNYKQILRLLIEHKITPCMQSVVYTSFEKHNVKIKDVNVLLKNYCKDNNITYIDLNKGLSKDDALIDKYTVDGSHLSAEGYKVWRDILSQYIK